MKSSSLSRAIQSEQILKALKLDLIKSTLKLNSYPINLIETNIKSTLNKLYVPYGKITNLNFDVPKGVVLFPTYFLGEVSKEVSREI